jgi:hypothetical protein
VAGEYDGESETRSITYWVDSRPEPIPQVWSRPGYPGKSVKTCTGRIHVSSSRIVFGLVTVCALMCTTRNAKSYHVVAV